MDRLSQLPGELLLHIFEHFLFEDLVAVSSTSRRLQQVVRPRLDRHRQLKRKYGIIRDRSWTTSDLRLGWFDVLARLLRSAFPAEYVSAIRLTNCPWYWAELSTFLLDEDNDADRKTPWEDSDMNAVVRAALSSPWIYRDGTHPCGVRSAATNMSDFVRELKEGDMDNILAVLLPLLTNLERLELAPGRDGVMDEDQPSSRWMGSVPGIVNRITRNALDPSRKHELLRIQNPAPYGAFQKLRHLVYDYTALSNILQLATFHELVTWISLPSLRRVDIYNVRDHDFWWPEDAPESHVDDVRIYVEFGQRISLHPVVELAKGAGGPCQLTHRNLDGSLHPAGNGTYDWQAVKVEKDGSILTLGGALPT